MMRGAIRLAALALACLAGAAALAQTSTPPGKRSGALLPGGDARQPVLIDADKLEWFDRDQRAIYSGRVVASQGESTLKSSRLMIFMARPGQASPGAPPATPAPAGQASGPAGGEIERMEADGPVELIQKDQTATGDRGEYSRAANTVTLIGSVTLTQGGNVTHGTRLVYDIDSRQAVVENPKGMFAPRDPPAASPAPAPAPAAPRRP